jgi:hypothetical protein
LKHCSGATTSQPQYTLQSYPFPSPILPLTSTGTVGGTSSDPNGCHSSSFPAAASSSLNPTTTSAASSLSFCNLDTTLLQAVMVRVSWLNKILYLRREMVERSEYPPLDLESTQTREEIRQLMERWSRNELTMTVVW